jgi:hypothetical protein
MYSNEICINAYPIINNKFKESVDPNLFYLIINNNELAIGKYVVFDPLVKEIQYFRKSTQSKK